MSSHKSTRNVIYGLGGQLIILALGILVPRLILSQYSDEANGLLNAISQIFTYLALIEAGIGQATVQALYKPVVENDRVSISAIMSASQKEYRRLAWIYAVTVIAFAAIYPAIITIEDTHTISLLGSSYLAVFVLIFVQGISSVVSFYYVTAYKQLFIADGQSYVISNLTTISQILISVAKIALIRFGVNIITLQIAFLMINALMAILYRSMFKRKYADINLFAKPDRVSISSKNSFMVHEISNAIFSSTDILLLSIFSNLRIASIYAVYNMVFSALNQLIGQVHNGCYYILGQCYNKDPQQYSRVHDQYDILYISLTFTLISVACLLINPFVDLYTAGVSTITYADPLLPVLFSMIQLLSCCRITASNLVKIAGHAKATVPRTICEAAINLAASVILVQFLGIYGVLLGTVIALLYRTNDFILYSNKVILHRSPTKQYFSIGIYMFIFTLSVIVSSRHSLDVNNYGEFMIIGIIATMAFAVLYFGIAFIVNKDLQGRLRGILLTIKDR